MGFFYIPAIKRMYGNEIITPRGRFAWPFLVNPKAPSEQMKAKAAEQKQNPPEARFEIQWLGQADDADVLAFNESLGLMVTQMLLEWNSRQGKTDPKLAIDNYLREADPETFEKYPYLANTLSLIARNKNRDDPTKGFIIKNAKKQVINPSEIVGGMIGRIVVQPHIGTSGLSFQLKTVYLLEDDGTRIGGAVRNHDALLDACGDAEELETEESTSNQECDDVLSDESVTGAVSAATEAEIDQAVDEAFSPEGEAPAAQMPQATTQVHGAAQKRPPAVVDPKKIQADIRAKAVAAAKGQTAAPAAQVASPGLKTGKGKQAALDNL